MCVHFHLLVVFEFDLFAALTFLKKNMTCASTRAVVFMAATFQAEIRLDSPVEFL